MIWVRCNYACPLTAGTESVHIPKMVLIMFLKFFWVVYFLKTRWLKWTYISKYQCYCTFSLRVYFMLHCDITSSHVIYSCVQHMMVIVLVHQLSINIENGHSMLLTTSSLKTCELRNMKWLITQLLLLTIFDTVSVSA